jgi:hypothetical protein
LQYIGERTNSPLLYKMYTHTGYLTTTADSLHRVATATE